MGKDQQAASSAAMDVDAWKAFGGKVEGKVYVAPGGERDAGVGAGLSGLLVARGPRRGGARQSAHHAFSCARAI